MSNAKDAAVAVHELPEHIAVPMDEQNDLVELAQAAGLYSSDDGAPSGPAPDARTAPAATTPRGASRSQRRASRMKETAGRRRQQALERRRRMQDRVASLGEHVATQLKEIKVHTPYFTYASALIQVVVMVFAVVPWVGGSTTHWGFSTTRSAHNVSTMYGSVEQEVVTADNLWYGPGSFELLRFGVKYTPCMRYEDSTQRLETKIKEREATFGCCTNAAGQCGRMTQEDCNPPYGEQWHFANTTCQDMPQCEHVLLRPCCFSLEGNCTLLSKDHCEVFNGYFHEDKELCSEAKCLDSLCGMVNTFGDHPNQFYRLITAVFMHIGVGHLAFNLMFQLQVCSELEAFSGFWRMAAMYLLSGIGGNIIASIFSPNSISAGSSGSLYGMLGVSSVELFQSWQLLEDKCFQVTRLVVMLVLMLGVGTLPWIDNWAHAGGFVVGVFSGMALQPYIYFGKWDERRKACLKALSLFVLFVAGLVGVVVFYAAPDPDFCPWCHYVNCVPYTDTICDDELHQQ